MYLTFEEYKEMGGSVIEESDYAKIEAQARDYIDILTFNRINADGFDNLSKFRRDKIKRCMFLLCDFIAENDDILSSYVNSYSINGVTASFDSNNLVVQSGAIVPSNVYGLLMQTGLCRRGFSY